MRHIIVWKVSRIKRFNCLNGFTSWAIQSFWMVIKIASLNLFESVIKILSLNRWMVLQIQLFKCRNVPRPVASRNASRLRRTHERPIRNGVTQQTLGKQDGFHDITQSGRLNRALSTFLPTQCWQYFGTFMTTFLNNGEHFSTRKGKLKPINQAPTTYHQGKRKLWVSLFYLGWTFLNT